MRRERPSRSRMWTGLPVETASERHRHRIARDQNVVGEGEKCEIGIVAGAVPEIAGCAGERVLDRSDGVGFGAARSGDQQAGAGLCQPRQLMGQFSRAPPGQPVTPVAASEQDGDARRRHRVEFLAKSIGFASKARGRDPMHRALGEQDIGADAVVVPGNDENVEVAIRQGRRLDLHGEHATAAGPADEAGGQGTLSAAANHQVGPWRHEWVANQLCEARRPEPQARGQAAPWLARAHGLEHGRNAETVGDAERLIMQTCKAFG